MSREFRGRIDVGLADAGIAIQPAKMASHVNTKEKMEPPEADTLKSRS